MFKAENAGQALPKDDSEDLTRVSAVAELEACVEHESDVVWLEKEVRFLEPSGTSSSLIVLLDGCGEEAAVCTGSASGSVAPLEPRLRANARLRGPSSAQSRKRRKALVGKMASTQMSGMIRMIQPKGKDKRPQISAVPHIGPVWRAIVKAAPPTNMMSTWKPEMRSSMPMK